MHYYLLIDSAHTSRIHQAESPIAAAAWLGGCAEEKCIVREGNADYHFLGYQFLANGTARNGPVDIIDLGPVSGYEKPLTYNRTQPGRYGSLA